MTTRNLFVSALDVLEVYLFLGCILHLTTYFNITKKIESLVIRLCPKKPGLATIVRTAFKIEILLVPVN